MTAAQKEWWGFWGTLAAVAFAVLALASCCSKKKEVQASWAGRVLHVAAHTPEWHAQGEDPEQIMESRAQ